MHRETFIDAILRGISKAMYVGRKDKYVSRGFRSMDLHGPTNSSKVFFSSAMSLVEKRAG